MKTLILICLFGLISVSLAVPKEYYTDKYDNIDVDEILGNRRLLLPYIKCALDQGKCSPSGNEMRGNIQESLETDCDRCTPKQKETTKRVLKHLIKNEKDYWNQVKSKYDPDNKFAARIEKEAEEL